MPFITPQTTIDIEIFDALYDLPTTVKFAKVSVGSWRRSFARHETTDWHVHEFDFRAQKLDKHRLYIGLGSSLE